MKESATWAIKATPSSTADYEQLTANDFALLDFSPPGIAAFQPTN